MKKINNFNHDNVLNNYIKNYDFKPFNMNSIKINQFNKKFCEIKNLHQQNKIKSKNKIITS